MQGTFNKHQKYRTGVSDPLPEYPSTSISALRSGDTKGTTAFYFRAPEPGRQFLLTAAYVLMTESFPEDIDNPFNDSVEDLPTMDIVSPGS